MNFINNKLTRIEIQQHGTSFRIGRSHRSRQQISSNHNLKLYWSKLLDGLNPTRRGTDWNPPFFLGHLCFACVDGRC
jgi:hypothetical protein